MTTTKYYALVFLCKQILEDQSDTQSFAAYELKVWQLLRGWGTTRIRTHGHFGMNAGHYTKMALESDVTARYRVILRTRIIRSAVR